jgi:hypothetical protein
MSLDQAPPAVGGNPAPWLEAGLRQPLPPPPADAVLDVLGPALERPLLVIEAAAPPAMADLVVVHRTEVEADYVEPPAVGAGDEPVVPARFAAGPAVLPHIDFPS